MKRDPRKYISSLYQVSAAVEEEMKYEDIIKKYEDNLPGGYADNKKPSDFDRSQLFKGIEVELEHTDNPMLALEIAMDHLTEIPDYYTHLEEMEQEAMGKTNVVTATLKKCREEDAKPGRPWCIYKHDEPIDDQPKGWPKTYETKEDAEEGLQLMHIHGQVTKAELKMVLSSLGVEVKNDQIRTADLKKVFSNLSLGAKKSLQPPKEWWDKMFKEISEGNPDYFEEQVRQTIGDIWYNDLDDAKRKEIRNRHGKEYGPADEGE